MKFCDRLKKIRKEKGMTQQEFADLLGTSKQVISRYEHGENTPKITTVTHYAEVLDVPIAYFTDESFEANLPLYPVSSRKVPVLEGISGGLPNYKNEKHVSTTAAGVELEVDFCLYATDDSMIGVRIGKGDIVFVQAQETVENGEIAAVAIEDDVMLRRVCRYEEQKVLMLRPENPAYDELVLSIDKATSVKILGKAVAFQAVL